MTAPRKKRTATPTLSVERSFAAHGHRYIAGCDEVGRGALAGPVSVGIVVVDLDAATSLRGVRDSKLLLPAHREALVPRIRRWSVACAVGHATAAEIDALGLMAALRTAGARAWTSVLETVVPDAVILDGNHDWLSARSQGELFGTPDGGTAPVEPGGCTAPVHTRIKADLSCQSVAAASVLAKVERDALMVELAGRHPAFGWDGNKGYATGAHREAIDAAGPSEYHRKTWRLGSADRPGATHAEIGG
ncbi:ribonuclease HII [Arthrobacter agilis]|jgi:ribonuclease HII|uniref:ribonuclease HII n=1 Tax=Arthrobacter agilis TaxID=37921 RepID=UPI0027818F78|nr:ribonuclease HII [Arthrobacter agilis]MDQ0735199.1 ribonuclease HII [Arthrobacter agilis]